MTTTFRVLLTLRAGLVYCAIVFGGGFLCGPFRVLLLEPRLGKLLAVLCEAPVMLGFMLFGSSLISRSIHQRRELVAAGIVALVLQQAAEFFLVRSVRGFSPEEWLAHFNTPEGRVYSALLTIFALMPAFWGTRGSKGSL